MSQTNPTRPEDERANSMGKDLVNTKDGEILDPHSGVRGLAGAARNYFPLFLSFAPFRKTTMADTLQDFTLQVKEGADLVAIIGQYLPLKRAGGRYLGVCPFHQDSRPSLNVNPRIGIYKCFACGAGGDVFKFVQEFERVGFMEALKLVAEKSGMTMPERFQGSAGSREKTADVLEANRLAAQVYTEHFAKDEAAQAYVRERGLTADALRHFQIGLAPQDGQTLMRRADSKKLPAAALVEAGILLEAPGGRKFDRFGGRLMFPIHNLSGHIIGFGGRLLPPKDGPKYVNSPESPVYHKSRVLYGFHSARQEIDQRSEAVLVEGYLDVISLWQSGIRNAVAVSGTALTPDHAQMLGRFARKAILCFDGDAAGRKAVHRSLPALLAQGMEIRIPVLPAGKDPDDLARERGEAGLRALFNEADDLSEFLVRETGKPVSQFSPEEKSRLMQTFREMLNQAPDPLVREEHAAKMAKLLGLRSPARSASPPRAHRFQRGADAAPAASARGTFIPDSGLTAREDAVAEWMLHSLIMADETLAATAGPTLKLEWFTDPRARAFADHWLSLWDEQGRVDAAVLFERLPEELRAVLAGLDAPETEDESLRTLHFRNLLATLEIRSLRRRMAEPKDLTAQMALQRRLQELLTQQKGRTP